MKQTLYAAAALTALTSAVFLSGCAGTQIAPSSAENDIPDYTTPQAQIDLIVDNRDLWLALAEEDAYDVWAYTVTDLDQNGRLELIAAAMGGTGQYTSAYFYEVSESFDALDLCIYETTEGDSQADLITDSVPVYEDPQTGTLYYVFDDFLKNGAAEYYENKRALFLENSQVKTLPLAQKTTIYASEDAEPQIACSDQNNAPISEAEYNVIAATVFDGFVEKTAGFNWYENWNASEDDPASLDADAWSELLYTSYTSFSLS